MCDVTFSLIQDAVHALNGIAHITPVLTSRSLNEISNARVFLKCENFQLAGAFKFRGAYHAVSHWVSTSSQRAFVTVSSGNHAQGLALACRLLGCSAHVAMPKASSSVKQEAARSYGAYIHEAVNRARAVALVDRLARKLPAAIIHPFNDPLVIAGQGTVMTELLEQVADLDVVLAPIGGGGLLAGLCIAAESLRPQLEIFACEPAGALDAIESIRQNRVVPMPDPHTIADGLRTSLGDRTLPILRRCLSGFFVVEEREILQAMRFAYERLKLVIEPSSAVALAPLLRKEAQLKGMRTAVVLTGGNTDLSLLWSGLREEISR